MGFDVCKMITMFLFLEVKELANVCIGVYTANEKLGKCPEYKEA